MKKGLTIFLQVVVVLIAISAAAFLIWEPSVEGVNANATTLSQIYFDDPVLAFAYIGSISFFVALYQIFKVLGYARHNIFVSPMTVKTLRTIKYCAMILIGFVVAGLVYTVPAALRANDDPAGGVAMGLFVIFGSIAVAIAAAMLERKLKKALSAQEGR